MVLLEIRSYAPMPSIDTTVALALKSVSACRIWATHSHTARVFKANSKGAVAFSENCCSNVSADQCFGMSPATIPRTPTSGSTHGLKRKQAQTVRTCQDIGQSQGQVEGGLLPSLKQLPQRHAWMTSPSATIGPGRRPTVVHGTPS